MKFLLTNDDGVQSPGLATLQRSLSELGETVVVAPHEHLSGCSHRVSTHRPLQLTEVGDGWHALDGTPADCTRLGLFHVAPDVDWVISGINEGANLGVDVHMSGTVAAVREAVLLGKPGIAFSQFQRNDGPINWSLSETMVGRMVERLRKRPLKPGTFWNVNFPDVEDVRDVPEIIECPLEPSHLPLHYEIIDGRFHYCGLYHNRPRTPGSDVDICFSGHISVTQVPAMSLDSVS
jgi:5'-nucleotidase